jgi:hypothetical protein
MDLVPISQTRTGFLCPERGEIDRFLRRPLSTSASRVCFVFVVLVLSLLLGVPS